MVNDQSIVCVFEIVSVLWYNKAIGLYDIYRERDGKWLKDSMRIYNSNCVWDIIWL